MRYLLESWHEQDEHDEEHERTLVEALKGRVKALGNKAEEQLKNNVHRCSNTKENTEKSPINLEILTVNFMLSLERQLRLFVLMNLILSPPDYYNAV